MGLDAGGSGADDLGLSAGRSGSGVAGSNATGLRSGAGRSGLGLGVAR